MSHQMEARASDVEGALYQAGLIGWEVDNKEVWKVCIVLQLNLGIGMHISCRYCWWFLRRIHRSILSSRGMLKHSVVLP